VPWGAYGAEFAGTFGMVAWGLSAIVTGTYRDLWVYLLGPLGGAVAVALLWNAGATSSFRSVLCAKLFHTDRYRCHLADCHFTRYSPADEANRKERVS
jgi:hypothetical protein